MVALFAVLGGYWFAVRRAGPPRPAPWRRAAFTTGWAIAALAFTSPLCALSVSLFSARIGQHMILALIAAPLIVLGRPVEAARLAGAPGLRLDPALYGPAASTAAFTLAMWFWHAPAPYAATFASPLIYWTMHLTILGSALMVWAALLDDRRAAPALGAGAVSTIQMAFLGALITLTGRTLYGVHASTTAAWGLTQHADQQLGGLIMWVPGCTVFLVASVAVLARMLGEPNAVPVREAH